MRRDEAHQPAPARKSASLSSPSAARRLYRNLSGKFRVGTNPPGLEDSVLSGRGGDKERLRKTTIVSEREREREKNINSDETWTVSVLRVYLAVLLHTLNATFIFIK